MMFKTWMCQGHVTATSGAPSFKVRYREHVVATPGVPSSVALRHLLPL